MNTYEQSPTTKVAMTVISIAAIAGGIVLADHLKSHDATAAVASPGTIGVTTTPDSSSSNSASSGSPAASGTSGGTGSTSTSSGYKNGTYQATATYFVPHGQESIQVTLTIKNNAIAAASIQNSETDPTSADFQQSFATEYQSQVVGRSLSGLQIDVVAGASDTTQGFNEAVNQIASQAKA